MSAQHTPGPWVTRSNGCADIGPHERVAKWIPGAGAYQIIANCSQEATGGTDREANARLIAAAPDLMEALQGAMEALAMCQPRTDHGAACQQVAMLAGRAALAKARGEA